MTVSVRFYLSYGFSTHTDLSLDMLSKSFSQVAA